MQDRFKFRYVFTKDFGGKTGICYKMPIFNLDTIIDENFNKIVKSYIDYDYKLISIEQSTGLKDKNGKLMYEGDIVKIWKFSKDLHDNNKRVIKWNDARCGFRLYTIDQYKRGVELCPQSMVNVTTIEVIGNIFQNSELLKGEK